jgi:Sporulation and spore germination
VNRRLAVGVSAFAGLALVAAVSAGCGLPDDEAPRELAADQIPFGLLEPSESGPSPEEVPGGTVVQLYFVEDDRLVEVDREIASDDPRPVIESLLQGLAADDPSSAETLIPADTAVNDVRREGSILVIDLNEGITSIRGPEQRQALAQLVFTATGLEGVTGVQFFVNGEPLNAISDFGEVSRPVDRGDYVSLQPPAPTTTTTSTTTTAPSGD